MKIKLGELRKLVRRISEASDLKSNPDFAKITDTKRPISDEEKAAWKAYDDELGRKQDAEKAAGTKAPTGTHKKQVDESSASDEGENGRSVPFPPKYPDAKAHFDWIETFGEYSDVYKEKHGIRPRWVTEETTSLQKLKQMLEDLYNELSTIDDEYGY